MKFPYILISGHVLGVGWRTFKIYEMFKSFDEAYAWKRAQNLCLDDANINQLHYAVIH